MLTTVRVEQLRKSYGPTVAVQDGSFACAAGSAHALLGENGAGKSTLVGMLSGVVAPDSGAMFAGDQQLRFRSPRDARAAGIGTASQELSLIPSMTVAQNLLLTEEPLGRLRLIARRSLNAQATAVLNRYDVHGLNPETPVERLPLSAQQKLEIVRAATYGTRICLFDESTSALTTEDVDWFAARVKQLRDAGIALIFITHRLSEVRQFCQDVTVLRQGMTVGTWRLDEVSDDHLIEAMLGKPLDMVYPPRPEQETDAGTRPVMLRAVHVARPPELQDVSLEIHEGEVVGIAAIQGQGQEILFRGLFGDLPIHADVFEVSGRRMTIKTPKAAIRAGQGIGLVPENRKTEGLFQSLPGTENLTISSLRKVSWLGVLRRRTELARAGGVTRSLNITPRAIAVPTETLSGGNQQKIVIGKWLLTDVQLLLLYDPTRGVDIGTKREIYDLLRQHATAGGSVLWYSTDVAELTKVCDRIIVLYAGQVVTEIPCEAASANDVLGAMVRGRLEAPSASNAESKPPVPGPRRPAARGRLPAFPAALRLPALRRNQATLIVFALALVLFFIKSAVENGGLTLFGLQSTINDSLSVGIAAMGETLVLLVGGFDLSAGSILSLLNVLLATQMLNSLGSQVETVVLALVLGALLGLLNGIFVVWLRLQPIIATLAIGFVWSGVALKVLPQPGGQVPTSFAQALTGAAGPFPNAVIVGIVAIVLWLFISRSRMGTNIYAVGTNRQAAAANGINTGRTLLAAYTFAGLFYAIAAIFLTAQTAGGDPNIGGPLLLTLFVAAAVGGASFSGGRGTAIASLIGGFVLELIGETLFAMGVASFYTDIFQGVVLIIAVAATLISQRARRGRQRDQARRSRPRWKHSVDPRAATVTTSPDGAHDDATE